MKPSSPTRRALLQAAGAAGLGVSLAGCEHGDVFSPNKPPVPGAAGWAKGEERWIATACGQCSAGCGLKVRVVEGRAVKVEGNSECPVNRGGVGPRGLAAPQVLYDPDRIKQPLIRRAKGGELEPVTWEEALEILTEKLTELREAEQTERLGVLCGRDRGLMYEIWQRFAEGFGTPNFFDTRGVEDGAQLTAMRAMQGIDDLPAYDWSQARLVLSLGSGVLDSSCQLLNFVRGRRGRTERARVVHVGPVLSRTAMNADEWISAAPGTSAALALGLAHVLVRDELFDAEFVSAHGQGFEDWEDERGWHLGLRSRLADYPPERVEEICGVSAAQIEELAHLAAESRPAFALAGRDDLRASNGVQTAMAVHALNALLGAIDRPGGLLVQEAPPLEDWPEVEPDDVALEGLERPALPGARGAAGGILEAPSDGLMRALVESDEVPLSALLIDSTNPLYSRADAQRWREALARVPFVVSCSPFADETTQACADLVLPDDSWLERWEDAGSAPNRGRATFGLRQPVVERLHDTRHTGDVLIEVAATLGDGVAEALPWKDFRDALKKRIIGLYKAKSGSIVESKGGAFLSRFYDEGFWASDEYAFGDWERVLRTESGRFEFCSPALLGELAAAADTEELSNEQLDALCGPAFVAQVECGDPARFPLLLVPFKPHTYAKGSGANLPWLAELAPWKGRAIWATEAELGPETAARFGISSGDAVELESESGRITARAFVSSGIREGLVRVPLGAGHTAYGRYASGWGANAMHLVSSVCQDPLGGSAPLQGMKVSIRRSES
jgi:anaerobic selenocysteine-containing dehydrogenase